MRIAQCLEYPLELRGGVSVVVENLAAQLTQRGHQIILASPSSALSSLAVEQHIEWNPHDRSLTNAKKLAQQLAASGIDIAHFHAGGNYGWNNRIPFRTPACQLSRLGVPVIWTSHRAETILDGYCGPQKPLLFKLLMLPLAWLGKIQQVSRCRFEIAVSDDNYRKLRRWYRPVRSRFVRIYHSRLPATPPAPSDTQREHVILSVGHFAAVKGQTVLVEAFARIAALHRDFTLQLVGDFGGDGTLERVKKIVVEHQVEKQVILLGEQTDTQSLMRRAAVYVQPSLKEALGLALQEAMFAGCACIGSRAGGIPELIEHDQNGLLFEPGNVEQLSQMLAQLIDNPPRQEQLGHEAANSIRAKGMTAEQMVKAYERLYATA